MITECNKFPSFFFRISILWVLTLGAAGCSQSNIRPSDPQYSPSQSVDMMEYQVGAGETLSKIARRITLNESNWKEIASINNIKDPRSLQTGMTLLIPNYMLLAKTQESVIASQAVVPVAAAKADSVRQPLPDKSAKNTGELVFQASAIPGPVQVDVKLSVVRVNRKFDLLRTDSATEPSAQLKLSVPMIRVVGTYYPKGIYAEPLSSSTLMMRVAPGTTFQFERQIGDWFRIKTDSGVGYIRSYDAEILGADQSSRLLVTTNNS